MKSLAAVLLALASLFTVGLSAAPRAGGDAARPRTVILVRHAEKDPASADPRDPSLSEAGVERARELARLLGASGAAHVFTSELKRTQETVAPLAARLGLKSEPVPAAKSELVVAQLDALPAGSLAIVCGHSNTVPRVAELLGVEIAGLEEVRGQRMLNDEAYDRVFVITRPASGPASSFELGYGAPASATSSSGK
jgi:phosphohistidine phosphatase SixA